MACAISSCRVPVTPSPRTALSTGATISIASSTARNLGLSPIKSEDMVFYSLLNPSTPAPSLGTLSETDREPSSVPPICSRDAWRKDLSRRQYREIWSREHLGGRRPCTGHNPGQRKGYLRFLHSGQSPRQANRG